MILPGATVGVVGGGQLGRMLALEARRMGYRTLVLDPGAAAPAAQVGDALIHAPLDDLDAARELARRSDVVTLEWENADVATLRELEETVPVRPGAHVLHVCQHRVREKEAVRRLGIGTADFRAVATLDELHAALREIGTPAVLKTARGGYDGKGQATIRSADEVAAAFAAVGGEGRELVLEGFVRFRMEISVVCARNARGETAVFPVAENVHSRGILDLSIVPARVEPEVADEARRIGAALAEGLDVVGLLAVEMFVTEDGRVLVNEMAPRPHNSGHYTWEGCVVSQFEQQLRAVTGLPLGSTELLRPSVMANLLGEDSGTGLGDGRVAEALAIPGVALHLYGKPDARAGRKMGHLTAVADSVEAALERATTAREAIRRGR